MKNTVEKEVTKSITKLLTTATDYLTFIRTVKELRDYISENSIDIRLKGLTTTSNYNKVLSLLQELSEISLEEYKEMDKWHNQKKHKQYTY